jgi:hypothetical protein
MKTHKKSDVIIEWENDKKEKKFCKFLVLLNILAAVSVVLMVSIFRAG